MHARHIEVPNQEVAWYIVNSVCHTISKKWRRVVLGVMKVLNKVGRI